MASEDSLSRPAAFAAGSTCPAGASSDSESVNSKPLRVVVWCVQREKFLKPCTDAYSSLPECACTPMAHYLRDGLMDRIRP